MDAASRNDQEFLKSFWYPNVKEGAEGVKFVEACVQSDKEGATWVEVK